MKFVLALYFVLFGSVVIAQSSMERITKSIEDKDYGLAESELQEWLAKYPGDNSAKELLGDAYGYQEKWDKAIEVYSELVDKNPKNANLQYKLGGSLGMKALTVNKLKALVLVRDIKYSLKEAVKLDPKHIEAHWALIEFYMALPGILGGSSKTALDYAESLSKISEVDGYLAKGYIYEYDDEPELAEINYLKAVKTGGSVVCYSELTDFYTNSKQPNKAIETIEIAQAKHQRNALHYQLGKVSADYNVQLNKGLQCLSIYIQNYTSKDGVPIEWAYYRRAQIYKHQNNKEQALVNIQKALEIRKDFPQALSEQEILLNL